MADMLVKTFSVILGASAIVAAGALGYMAADRATPIKLLSAHTNTVRVRPGEDLVWTVRFVQTKRCFIHSDRALIDAENVRHPLEPIEYKAGIGRVGTEQEIVLKVPVPADMAIGTARYESSTMYRCNPLHWLFPIYSPFRPVFFEVVML